jgi:hypothetical protein
MTFSKGIKDPDALLAAMKIRDRVERQAAINALAPISGTRKLVGLQSGLTTTDPSPLPGTPADDSPRTAAELAELGLMVLLRDVPLSELATNPTAIRGAEMLRQFGISRMLHGDGPNGLFRLNNARVGADRVGKLVMASIPTGWGEPFSFKAYRRLGSYGTTQAEWQALQDGTIPRPQEKSATVVPMTTGRDVASLAHDDAPIHIGDCVLRLLLANKAPYSSRMPANANEQPQVDPGGLCELTCANGIATMPAGEMGGALKFIDYRRARPEELWPRAVRGELHESFLRLAGWIVEQVGPYLPMTFAEGAPLHSDDPSWHSVFAGVWMTLAKAWFADGAVPSLGITGNLHAEIDLLGWHQAIGRSWAGIHSRKSLTGGLRLGEIHALEHLRKQSATGPRPLGTTTFIGVDGKPITV